MNRRIHFSIQLLFRDALAMLVGIVFCSITPQPIAHSSSADLTEDVPRFEEGNCQDIFPRDWWNNIDQKRFRCGYLVTWENYDTQNRTIWLAVMETYPKRPKPYPDPIVWLAGGPGASGFDGTPDQTTKYVDDGLGRGWIQFSQRGSYLSQSELKCGKYYEAITSNWDQLIDEKPLGWEKWSSVQSDALVDCFQDLEKEHGADYLVNINSKFNALDVIYLIRELGYGYGHANLYGGSYGTLLAQHVLVLSPGDIRSVVLANVAPLGVDWKAEYPRNMRNSLQLIFDACNTSSKCRETYPNLEHTFFVLLDQLNDQPLCIPVKDGNETFSNVCLDDYGFLLAIGNMLPKTENIKKIPRIIYGSWNRDLTQIAELGENYYAEERNMDFPWGMHYSTYCTEFARFDPDSIDLRQAEQQFQTIYTASKQLINKICPLYDKNGKSYGDVGIVNNKVPILIFNGKFDPVTPMKYGRQVADALSVSDGFQFTSDRSAHDSVNSKCAVEIMKDFFNKPEEVPNRDCWKDESKPVEFELANEGNQASETSWWQEIQKKIADTADAWWQEQQQKIKDSFDEWWQEQQKKIEDALNQWWQDFQKRLAQWFEQQLTEWLNQCLPSAVLPLGIVAGVWISRHRKKNKSF
jgi:pimeloyl-ACP methyl ester carboxylesterase